MEKFARILIFIFSAFLVACSPLPTRDNTNVFKLKSSNLIAKQNTLPFMDCLIDGFNRTDNSIRHEFETTQQLRSNGYRVERRWSLKPTLLILSVDILNEGVVDVFENSELSSIAPFVSTREEAMQLDRCLKEYKSLK